MEPTRRQQTILDCLAHEDECAYVALAKRLRVSAMTVRRDVNRLAAAGRLIKTLRGARRAEAGRSLFETDLRSRLNANLPEKMAIAAKALTLLRAGQTVYLDGSTTCLELAKRLAQQGPRLTVITNSALLCLHLGLAHDTTVICLGGQYDADSLCLAGPEAEASAERLYFDVAFLSTKGFLPRDGTFESAAHLFRLKQLVVRHAREVVLLVDHTKFGNRALCKAVDITAIQRVVTDAGTSPEYLAALRQAGVAVDVAPPLVPPASRRRLRVSPPLTPQRAVSRKQVTPHAV